MCQQDHGHSGLPLVIDAHCHIFNAQDVDVVGFIKGPVAAHVKPPVKPFLKLLADNVATTVRDKAPSGADELVLLEANSAVSDADAAARDAELDHALAEVLAKADRWGKLTHHFRAAQTASRLDAMLAQAVDEDQPDDTVPATDGAPGAAFAADHWLHLLAAPDPGAAAPENRHRTGGFDPAGVITLLKRLCSRRSDTAHWLAKAYQEGTPAVTLFMPAPVDYDHWLSTPSPTPIRDQIAVLERIAIARHGTLLPLVPYNPWTDIVDDDASLKLVREAIGDRGFVGVKIYPPMGYQPYGNDASCWKPTGLPGERTDVEPCPPTAAPPANWPADPGFGAQLDAKLLALYQWCVAAEVPVLTHASSSQGVTAGLDAFAGPNAWCQVLSRCPGLRVCLGHFGGDKDKGDGDSGDKEWSRRFLELMAADEARNLHADLSYLPHMFVKNSTTAKLVAEALTSPFAGRFLYGSDWHLLATERHAAAYPASVDAFVKELPIAAAARDRLRQSLFCGSAVRLYGLRQGEQNRTRLDAFYAQHGLAPAWRPIVDSLPTGF